MMEAKFRTDKLQNGNCDTADNFVSPNTADFKTQTSHTVRFKNTATPQAEILFTATPHEKMPNTATPQIPNVPLLEHGNRCVAVVKKPRTSKKGQDLLLGANSPFKNVPLLNLIL